MKNVTKTIQNKIIKNLKASYKINTTNEYDSQG